MKKILFVLFVLFLGSNSFSENYAILISGDLDPNASSIQKTYGDTSSTSVADEFWNDLFLVWETLYNKGFKDENIIVFFEDGEGVNDPVRYNASPYGLNDIVDYEAERSTILTVLGILPDGAPLEDIPQITEDDFLFVFTFGHGNASSTDTTLIVRDGTISDTELSSYLDDIPFDKRVIWMQQCYSGGFIDDLSNSNSVIITACKPDELSFRADGVNPDGADNYESEFWGSSWTHHGEFNYHSLNAVNLETIVGNSLSAPDKNSDNKTSIQELYDWADSTESSKTEHVVGVWTYGPQHPQMDDAGSNASSVFIDVDPPTVTISGSVVNNHPKISWTAPSGIQDIDEYEVWRYRTVSGGGYTLRTTVTGTNYTDTGVYVQKIPPFNKVYYKVKVVDDAGNKSGYSNAVDFWDSSTSKPITMGNENSIPTDFSLKQNYPNPFNPETKINFGLPEDSFVKLDIFNLQGQIVTTLVDGSLEAGYHTATFNATSFPSGVYFYKLVAGNFIDIKRMLLVK